MYDQICQKVLDIETVVRGIKSSLTDIFVAIIVGKLEQILEQDKFRNGNTKCPFKK